MGVLGGQGKTFLRLYWLSSTNRAAGGRGWEGWEEERGFSISITEGLQRFSLICKLCSEWSITVSINRDNRLFTTVPSEEESPAPKTLWTVVHEGFPSYRLLPVSRNECYPTAQTRLNSAIAYTVL